jgi:nicotinic acid mononucleotide adenylyltransferase
MDISSSLIRNMINKKESIKHLVPKEVFLKIKKKQI